MDLDTDRSRHFEQTQKAFVDAGAFEFRGLNLAKVVYDYQIGKYRAPLFPSKKGRVRGVGYLAVYPFRLLRLAGRILVWRASTNDGRRYLFFGSPRTTDIDGVRYDLYNPRIVETLGRKRVLIVEEQLDMVGKQYSADICLWDLLLPLVILRGVLAFFWRSRLSSYAERLLAGNPDLKITPKEISSLVVRFWSWRLLCRPLVRAIAPDRAFIICNYGVPGLITACKELGVPATELMHGSILKLHPHYGSPHITGEFIRAFARLLPDDIGVYGQYWKENLVAGGFFPEKDIFIVGYYLQMPPKLAAGPRDGRTTILISTQAPFQREWLQYIAFLRSSLSPAAWHVLVKPHPNEKEQAYRELAVPGFVDVVTDTIYGLLPMAQIHLSVRSTVLYEAVRYGLINYILIVERVARECQEIVDSGIALPLRLNELPRAAPGSLKAPEYYFADYDPFAILARS